MVINRDEIIVYSFFGVLVCLLTSATFHLARASCRNILVKWKRNALISMATAIWPVLAVGFTSNYLLVPPILSKLDESEKDGHYFYTQKKQGASSADRQAGQNALSAWGRKYVEPMRLAEQIVSSGMLVGMKKRQVLDYLGEPIFPESEKLWFYAFFFDDSEWYFKIEFEHGVVVKTYLEH